jgi:hypothetical protein
MFDSYLKELIPKDKFDKEVIPKLMQLSEDEISPILPNLLSWTADINWPIAEDIIRVLIRFPYCIVPLIREKLKPTETDEDWKYFIITDLIPQLALEAQKLLTDDISRIIDYPTDGEKDAEVWTVANIYKGNQRK